MACIRVKHLRASLMQACLRQRSVHYLYKQLSPPRWLQSVGVGGADRSRRFHLGVPQLLLLPRPWPSRSMGLRLLTLQALRRCLAPCLGAQSTVMKSTLASLFVRATLTALML